jgi:hypothetical protein
VDGWIEGGVMEREYKVRIMLELTVETSGRKQEPNTWTGKIMDAIQESLPGMYLDSDELDLQVGGIYSDLTLESVVEV